MGGGIKSMQHLIQAHKFQEQSRGPIQPKA